jgi:hypothetical protein
MRNLLTITFSIICLTTFAQDQKIETSSFITKNGESITDTIWYKKQYVRKVNTSNGEYYVDSSWVIDTRTNYRKNYRNPVLPATQKGNVSLGAWINSTEGFRGVRVGYFSGDNFVFGAGLYGNYDFDASDILLLDVNVYIRQYFGASVKNKTFIEGELGAELISGNFSFGASLGKTIFTGNNFGIDLGIGYKTNFETGGSLTFGIGFQGIIPTKK